MAAEENTQEPYAVLAGIYDYVMRHVDYAGWAGHVDALLQRFGHRGGLLADLACGTGNATFELQDLGHAVEGVDASAAMVRIANEKAAHLKRDITFRQGDLRDLQGLGPYAGAVCLYDSFNYLLEPAAIKQALEAVRAVLAPDGLFVFDVCTRQNSLRHFRDIHDAEVGPGFSYRRHSRYDETTHLQYNRFEIRLDEAQADGDFFETHIQRIYALDELEACIDGGAFELLGTFDGFTFEPGDEGSDRVHYVMRRSP